MDRLRTMIYAIRSWRQKCRDVGDRGIICDFAVFVDSNGSLHQLITARSMYMSRSQFTLRNLRLTARGYTRL